MSIFEDLQKLNDSLDAGIADAERYSAPEEPKVLRSSLRNYGLTRIEYNAMLEKQHGRCAACEEEKPLHIDHDHETGEVRGLLCQECNCALGFVKDDVITLTRLIAYLEKRI